MHTRHLFRPLAAATLALGLVSPAAAAPPSETLTTLLAEQAGSAATAEQLAAQYPALALLPAHATEFATVNDVEGLLRSACRLLDMPWDDSFKGLDSIALATTPANMQWLAAFLDVSELEQLFLPGQRSRERREQQIATLGGQPLAPIYLVITCKAGQEHILTELKTLFDTTAKAKADSMPAQLLLPLAALRPDGRLECSTRLEGQQLLITLRSKQAEPQAELHFPATPADSVLASAAGRQLSPGKAGAQPIAAAHLSAESLGALLSPRWSKSADKLETLAERIGHRSSLAAFCRSVADYRPSRPALMQAWKQDSGVELTASMDAWGLSYETSSFRHLNVVDSPDTIFYAESTPLRHGQYRLAELLLNTGEGMDKLIAKLPAHGESATRPSIEGKAVMGLGTVMEGLTGHTALVANAWLLDGSLIPTLSFTAGIADRAKLGAGWDMLADALADMVGCPLPFTCSVEGNATTYTFDAPKAGAGFLIPQAILTDKHLACSTMQAWPHLLLQQAEDSGEPAAGTLFALHTRRLQQLIHQGERNGVNAPLPHVEGHHLHGYSSITEGVFTLKLRTDLKLDK